MKKAPLRFNIDFLSKSRIAATISVALVGASFVLFFAIGPNYGIDFAGGTNIIVRVHDNIEDDQIRQAMTDLGFADAVVQRFGDAGDRQFLIQTRAVTGLDEEHQTALGEAMNRHFGPDATFDFDAESGDRVYVRVPPSAYEAADAAEGSAVLDATPQTDEEVDRPATYYANRADRVGDEVEVTLTEAGLNVTEVLPYGNPADRQFVVRVMPIQGKVQAAFTERFGEDFVGIDRVETVGPRVGAQLRNDAMKAVFFALICILLYIAFRFDFRYAPGAVVALFHDVMITLGIFIVLREEINLATLAAFLTIVGYSLNDTIVNYDRIRENLEVAKNPDLVELVNRSLNECLSRTLLTSITILIAVLAIFILGGGLIKSFALALIIGVIVGTYSSIYVASPIVIATNDYFDGRSDVTGRLAAANASEQP